MRGDDFSNVWYDYGDGTWDPAVLASANNIVLVDRRKIKPPPRQSGERNYMVDGANRYPWMVYDSRPDSHEWQGFKTRKAAIARFVHLAMVLRKVDAPRLIDGTVAEPAWRARVAYLAEVQRA